MVKGLKSFRNVPDRDGRHALTDMKAHLSLRRVTALVVCSVTEAGCRSVDATRTTPDPRPPDHTPEEVIDRLVIMAAEDVLAS